MKPKMKNTKSNLSEFIRYIRGEMTKKEEHAFQRELQKDPFAEEAEEGLSGITAEDAESDITTLQKRLDGRVKRRSTVVFYRIAASVAVLLVISTIFFVTRRNDNIVSLSENKRDEKIPLAIVDKPEPIMAQEIAIPDQKEAPPPSKEIVISDDISDSNMVIDKNVEELNLAESVQITVKDTVISEPETALETTYIAEARSLDLEASKKMASVAAAPTVSKSMVVSEYIPPQPVIGKDSFDLYLENNIRNPEPESPELQAVVMNFKVLTDNTLTNIIIISSPGEAYSAESVRLLKNGPLWQPAEKNGMFIEDTLSIRIEFK